MRDSVEFIKNNHITCRSKKDVSTIRLLRRKLRDSDVIVLKADKGNAVILIMRE